MHERDLGALRSHACADVVADACRHPVSARPVRARREQSAKESPIPHTKKPRSELKNTGYEIFIGILSMLSIVNLVLVYAFIGDQSMQTVLTVMNALFSLIFLGDFIFRISTAPSRGVYFFRHFGWADLLASLPLAQLKILRVFRLVRVFRLLRELGPRTIWRTLIKDRAGSALLILLLLGILVLQFGSLTMLYIEKDAPGATITSASDALWYVIVTISTVGYGDTYPVTSVGRLTGALIIVIGVGIFGTFTGYLANLFLSPQSEDAESADAGAPAAVAPGDPEPVVRESAPSDSGGSKELDELRTLLLASQAELADIKRLLSPGEGSDGGGQDRDPKITPFG